VTENSCVVCEGGWGKYWNIVLAIRETGLPAHVCEKHTQQSRDAVVVSSGENKDYMLKQVDNNKI
jgi:hypothetical protein